MSQPLEIPLFPLHTVLFPGGVLALRIFEARYLDMIARCLRTDSGFGVCLIREGPETGGGASVHPVGTLARIGDWEQRPDGLLGIEAHGERRLRVRATRSQPDGLLLGEVEHLAPDGPATPPPGLGRVADLLREVYARAGGPVDDAPLRLDDAGWVADRVAQLLPLAGPAKQRLLETSDPVERLALVDAALQQLQAGANPHGRAPGGPL